MINPQDYFPQLVALTCELRPYAELDLRYFRALAEKIFVNINNFHSLSSNLRK